MRKLTIKQERFVTSFVACGNATMAAKEAGYNPKYVATNTTKLLTNTNISTRIEELRTQLTNEDIWTVQDRLSKLKQIAKKGNIKQTNPVEAIKEYNRMTGAYPPQQHQIAQKVLIEVVYEDRKST